MINTERILEKADLLAIIEKDIGPGKKHGRWHLFRCPFPGHARGDRNPSLSVTPDNGRYYCFTCRAGGNAITWLIKYHQLRFSEACQQLGVEDFTLANLAQEQLHTVVCKPSIPPLITWQDKAREFVDSCEINLWNKRGAKALAYLRDERKLTDRTIKHYRLGYHPANIWEPLQTWGLPEDIEHKDVYLPRGIVIPAFVDNNLWYVNIRRPKVDPKYFKIRGGKAALFGADYLTGAEIILITEGEFDCMLANQLIGDVAGVSTLGSATQKLDISTWGRYLMPARAILVALDFDNAGRRGIDNLIGLSAQIHPARVPVLRPGDKDITDYVSAGGDLWEWMKYQLVKLGVLQKLGATTHSSLVDRVPIQTAVELRNPGA